MGKSEATLSGQRFSTGGKILGVLTMLLIMGGIIYGFYYSIHDFSLESDKLENWGVIIYWNISIVFISGFLLLIHTEKINVETLPPPLTANILWLTLALLVIAEGSALFSNYHYNKKEQAELTLETNRLKEINRLARERVVRMAAEAADAASVAAAAAAAAAAAESEEAAIKAASCGLINSYHDHSSELLVTVEDIINELGALESIVLNNATEAYVDNFETIKAKIEGEYQTIKDEHNAINTISCQSECESCQAGFTNYLDETMLSGVTECNSEYTACTGDTTCSTLLSQEYGTDSTGGYENQDLTNLYSCYCANVPADRGPCITGSSSDQADTPCDGLDQLTEDARLACSTFQHEISETNSLLQDYSDIITLAEEALRWNNMTEYFEKEGQADCLQSDDRSREENLAAMDTCLKRYFVSGNYAGVSSGETDFQTVCDPDLKTDERIAFIKAGGQGDTPHEKYMYQYLVKSNDENIVNAELGTYCSGICPAGEVNERCNLNDSRIRRSVNHFNGMMSNMKACSDEGATVDTTGDGVNDSCSTGILTDPKMYYVLNDLIVTN